MAPPRIYLLPVLGASTCELQSLSNLRVQTPPLLQEANSPPLKGELFSPGGEGGIRTLDRFDPTHDFESCAFNHSATSPDIKADSYCS